MGILFVLGLMSAGLMMSTVLVFISGSSLIGTDITGSNILLDVYNDSRLVRIMVDYANVWFLIPGVVFVILGIFHKKSA